MRSEFKVGDKVYLKEEAEDKNRRIWTITSIRDNGVIWLERIIKRKGGVFRFFESAKPNELIKE